LIAKDFNLSKEEDTGDASRKTANFGFGGDMSRKGKFGFLSRRIPTDEN